MRRTSAIGGAGRDAGFTGFGSGTSQGYPGPARSRTRLRLCTDQLARSGKLLAMRLDHGGLLVSDVERAVRFYTGALGLERVPRPPTFDTPGAWLKVGEQHQIHLVGEAE